jgi:hypothetical protein
MYLRQSESRVLGEIRFYARLVDLEPEALLRLIDQDPERAEELLQQHLPQTPQISTPQISSED